MLRRLLLFIVLNSLCVGIVLSQNVVTLKIDGIITMAGHTAATAPGTNIGAAHPVDMEGKMDSVMSDKVANDASAFIRTIAEKRNRNMKWAGEAVRISQG